MKIMVTSDWHLDAVTAGVSRFDEISNKAMCIANAALDEGVDMFAFLGDLCDPGAYRPSRCLKSAILIAEILAMHKVPSRWLTGNHDVIEDGHGSHMLMPMQGCMNPLIQIKDEPSVELFKGVQLVWLPYTPSIKAYDPAEFIKTTVPGIDAVVFGHLWIGGIVPGSETHDLGRGRSVYLPIEEIKEHFDTVTICNGHYHEQQEFNGVYIPGSIERLTFGEEHHPSKGCLILEL